MKVLKRIDWILARVEGWLIIAFLSLMISLTFLQVVFRALYTQFHMQWANAVLGQMDWSEPLVRLLILWLTFLGASVLTGDKRHIKIDIMSSWLPDRWRPFHEIILSLSCMLIASLMLKTSIGYLRMEMDFGGLFFATLPSWIGYLIFPAGFSMILFRYFLNVSHQILAIARSKRP